MFTGVEVAGTAQSDITFSHTVMSANAGCCTSYDDVDKITGFNAVRQTLDISLTFQGWRCSEVTGILCFCMIQYKL